MIAQGSVEPLYRRTTSILAPYQQPRDATDYDSLD